MVFLYLVKDTEATVESAPTLLPSYKEVKEEVVAKGERDNQSSDEEDLTIIGELVALLVFWFAELLVVRLEDFWLVWFGDYIATSFVELWFE